MTIDLIALRTHFQVVEIEPPKAEPIPVVTTSEVEHFEYDDHGNRVLVEPPKPLTILTFDQIEAIPISDDDMILGDHLLDKGTPLVMAGQGGTGKSRLAFQFIAATKAGHEKFLTFDIHPGARSMRWLVLQTENSARRLKGERRRLLRWVGEPVWNQIVNDILVLTPEKEQDTMLNLNDVDVVLRIKTAIELFKPDGVICDPLGDFSTGDLNKDMDMSATVKTLSRLVKTGNPKRALIILHHSLTGQAGAAKATGYDRSSFARNSKVLFNWTRAQINIAPMQENNNDDLAVSCGKCSDGREFVSFGIKLNPDTLIYECDETLDVAAWSSDIKGGNKSKPDIDAVGVQRMTDPGIAKQELAKRIMNDIGCSRMSAYRHISKAILGKKIKENDGKMFKS